jgi:hypothetical protein
MKQHIHPSMTRRAVGTAIAILATTAASAQEALNMDAATQPSPGVVYLYERARITEYGSRPDGSTESTRRFELDTTILAGLTTDLALVATVPVEWSKDRIADGSSDSDFGVGDPEVLFKYRIYKSDSASVDTLRVALLGGVELPSGDNGFTSHSVDPIMGVAATMIRGRHGFNLATRYKLNTNGGGGRDDNFSGDGPADALRYDASYLYRLYPASWATTSDAAFYAVFELNGLYETSGDNEILFSPGLLLEARKAAIEIGARLPLLEDMEKRPETDWALVAGVGFFF